MSVSTLAKAPSLTTCQEKAMDILLREGNVFLTGAAGTGKSFLLSRYLLGKSTDDFPVVASTGAAAVIVGGRTFHSFFGIGIMEGGLSATVSRAMKNRRLLTRLQRACSVIVDEISMLSGDTLLAAEMISRKARNNEEPWGGLRIIAVGDFAQLPPVSPGSLMKDWSFTHPVWQASDFQPALLSTVMRTQDIEFLEILNFIREGIVNERVREYLDARVTESSDRQEGTRLYPHRAQADRFNLRRLDSLPSRLHEIPTQYEGDERYLQSAKKSLPISDVLQLKENALVMMRKNDVSFPQRYVNGSLGHVRRVTHDQLSINLLSGECIEVEKEKFSSLDGDGKEVMAAWNFPVSLAWATTIHKAQGASLDKLIVDLHSLWEPGQAYVALSRVRSGDGLSIERWSSSSIRAEPLVTAFYDKLSDAARKYVPRPLFTIPVSEIFEDDMEDTPRKPSKKKAPKKHKGAVIHELLQKKMPLDEIGTECDLQADRVIIYIEKLLLEGIPLEIEYLLENLHEADRVRSAFENLGIDRLKPVFESLGEEVPYLTLRIVRCVMVAEGI